MERGINTMHHFLCAQTQGERLLFDLGSVREVLPAMSLTAARKPRPGFRGLANVRGEVIAVFDSARREGPLSPSQLIILATTFDGSTIGVVVDDVLDVLAVAPDDIVTRPVGGGRSARAVRLPNAVELVVTPDEVVDAA